MSAYYDNRSGCSIKVRIEPVRLDQLLRELERYEEQQALVSLVADTPQTDTTSALTLRAGDEVKDDVDREPLPARRLLGENIL